MFIDTHTHLDAEEFDTDRNEVIERAFQAGASRLMIPAIDYKSTLAAVELCKKDSRLSPMIGLHPEEVRDNWQDELSHLYQLLQPNHPFIAIGEIGLDYYWSREYAAEQLQVFELQVQWAIEWNLPLMIHCRKAQNEMVRILRKYEKKLTCGGVFHCFTGNAIEAKELLSFDNFVLGIGGVVTFKKSNLPQTLSESVPLDRIVLETDSPYMAPVPKRGTRNESSFIPYIIGKLSEIYGVSTSEVETITTHSAEKMFSV